MEQKGNKHQRDLWLGLRRCLCCGVSFVAHSPYLRVCSQCKDSEEWQSGNVDIIRHHAAPTPANDN